MKKTVYDMKAEIQSNQTNGKLKLKNLLHPHNGVVCGY